MTEVSLEKVKFKLSLKLITVRSTFCNNNRISREVVVVVIIITTAATVVKMHFDGCEINRTNMKRRIINVILTNAKLYEVMGIDILVATLDFKRTYERSMYETVWFKSL